MYWKVANLEVLAPRKEHCSLRLPITHDLTSVTYLCNKALFLYKGEVAEMIKVENISQTQNSYAKTLLKTIIPT